MNEQIQFFLNKALENIRQSKYDVAEMHLKNAQKVQKNNPHVLRLIGIVFAEKGLYENALVSLSEAHKLSPKNSEILGNLGNIYFLLKKFSNAIEMYDKSLRINPYSEEILSNKGNALYELKLYNAANECHEKSIIKNQNYYPAYSNKGNVLLALKRYDEAIAYYDKALSLKPDYAEGWSNKGNALYELKRYDEAIAHHDKALSLKPDFAEGWSNKGNVLLELKLYNEAIAHFDQALSLKHNYAEAYSNKGNVLLELKIYNEAIAEFDQALSLNPNLYDAWTNKGKVLYCLSKFEEAIACYDKALLLNPNNALALSNKGTVLFDLDRYDEAEQCYLEAENIDKSYDTNTYNYALLLLGKKQFPIGWKKYKYRWKWDGFTSSPLQTSKPEWLGNRSTNRLLLWGEQGIGDQILYASMLSDLQSFPQEKIVAVNKKLLPIFIRSFPNFSFIGKDEFLPEEKYDEHFPLGDLGGFFRTDVASFESARFPYLVDDAARTNTIRGQLSNNRNLKCGVSWKSSNRDVGDSKSMALSEWMPLLQKNEIDFINLQYGDTVDELEKLRANNIHINEIDGIDLFEDVDGALSIIQACDIIITVSNTTAHLAGALGKKTYLLLSKGRGKFWYWHQSKNKNLWYPSVQIIEQDSPGDWNSAVQKLITEIEK